MRIRIRPDDSTDGGAPEPAEDQTIIVARQDDSKHASQKPKEEVNKGTGKRPSPSQTTWAMVSCQCTQTGRSFQLAFRRDAGTFVLKSIDPTVLGGTAKDMSGVDGPFEWGIFECPECGRSWRKGGDTEPPFPVVFCSCRSLFCSKKGVSRRKGGAGDEWWWHCPRCGVDDRIMMRIDSLNGQAVKGK